MEEVFDVVSSDNVGVEITDVTLQLDRATLLQALKTVIGVVEQSQILQILSHVKMVAVDSQLTIYASDSEVELITSIPLISSVSSEFSVTIPGKKLLDICRTLPDSSDVSLRFSSNWVNVSADGGIEFTIATLPASSFPVLNMQGDITTITLQERDLFASLGATSFAMAQHDVRHFLNGMLFSFNNGGLSITATDGHRMAMGKFSLEGCDSSSQAIIPRKAVAELARLLSSSAATLKILFSADHIRFEATEFVLSTRLIDGSFPACEGLIPEGGDKAVLPRMLLKQALSRAAVLAKERYHGAKLHFSSNLLRICSNNSDNEKTNESFAINYTGEDLTLAFNISYLSDVVNAITSDSVEVVLVGSDKSVLIKPYVDGESADFLYVVMPMTL